MPSPIFLLSVAVLAVVLLVAKLRSKPKGKLPPGPKGLPLIGNIADLPPPGTIESKHWLTHKDKYGPISSVTALGQTIVLLHDHDLAIELLEKRANLYSERPQMVFAAKLCGFQDWLGFQNNTPLMKAYRKDIHSVAGSTASLRRAMPATDEEISRFVVRTAKDPDNWERNQIKSFASVILNIAYGYRNAQDGPDPLIDMSHKAMEYFGDASMPGKWMVDVFHWMQYIPDWVPGASFKRKAKLYSQAMEDSATLPLRFTQEKLQDGTSDECLIADLLNGVDPKTISDYDYNRIRRGAGALFAGGSDTTSATISWFVVHMMEYPDFQRRAQAEIDRVVGTDRLPTFEDRPNLPLVDALWKETMRFQTIGAFGIPHSLSQDDWVNGYLIPKDSIIMPHTAWFLHDPKRYKDPETYNPDRFLGDRPEPDPEKSGQFGYGRRVCPGKGLADQAGWLFIAKVLSVFDIVPKKDSRGDNIVEKPEPMPGLVTHPTKFQVSFKPRSKLHSERISVLERSLDWSRSDGEAIRRLQSQLYAERERQ